MLTREPSLKIRRRPFRSITYSQAITLPYAHDFAPRNGSTVDMQNRPLSLRLSGTLTPIGISDGTCKVQESANAADWSDIVGATFTVNRQGDLPDFGFVDFTRVQRYIRAVITPGGDDVDCYCIAYFSW